MLRKKVRKEQTVRDAQECKTLILRTQQCLLLVFVSWICVKICVRVEEVARIDEPTEIYHTFLQPSSVLQWVSARCLSVRPTCDVDILDTNHTFLETIRHNQSPTATTQKFSRLSQCLTQSLAGDDLFRRCQLKSCTPTSSSSDRLGQTTTFFFFPDIYAELPVQAGNNRK